MKLFQKVSDVTIEKFLRLGHDVVAYAKNTNGSLAYINPNNKIVTTDAAALVVTAKNHANRTIVLNSTHTQTVTLPDSVGNGDKYRFAVSVVGTDGSKVIKVNNTADVMQGVSIVNSTATDQASSFLTSATSDTVTLNNTTTGGIVGTTVEIEDIAIGTFLVRVQQAASGTVSSPFSAAVS